MEYICTLKILIFKDYTIITRLFGDWAQFYNDKIFTAASIHENNESTRLFSV